MQWGWCKNCAALVNGPATKGISEPCDTHAASLNRTLRFTLGVLLKQDMSIPFRGAVNLAECPGLPDIVKNPIDLGEIQAKQQRGEYKSIEQFFSDIDLLHSNCVLYCETRYPDLVADASKLRVMAKLFPVKLRTRIGWLNVLSPNFENHILVNFKESSRVHDVVHGLRLKRVACGDL